MFLDFLNTTTKEQFEYMLNESNIEITDIKVNCEEYKYVWLIKDKYNSVWIVARDEIYDTWNVYAGSDGKNIIHFNEGKKIMHLKLAMRFDGLNISILESLYNDELCRTKETLKRFMQLAVLINCIYVFGYFKEYIN